MECNKDEAVRAKEIAERKMGCDDFRGAQKIAKKAQGLFPELENISQLLTVCDVHCSAQNKLSGSDMDWYGILQVQSYADEVAIRKQYRKLALLLHPDKNKFPGAEAAFKLIGQANMVLSDPGKRALYDSKCRVSMRTAATKPPSQKSTSVSSLGVFWTSCPFCYIRYQYQMEFVNKLLLCQNCSQHFIAYNVGAQGVSQVFTSVRPVFPQQKQFTSQGSFKMESQGTGGFPSYNNKTRGTLNQETTGGARPVRGTNLSSTKGKDGKEGFGSAKVDQVNKTSKSTTKKRRRKLAAESSESFDSESSADIDEETSEQNSGLKDVHPRRSSRKKDHVSYKENVPEDDSFCSPPKRSKIDGSCKDSKEAANTGTFGNGVYHPDAVTGLDRKKKNVKQGNIPPEESFLNREVGAGKHKANGAEDSQDDDKKFEDDDSKSDSECSPPSPMFYETPEPEFNDFDKDKGENCFSVDQIWACYDTDGMPRFYARVKKVLSPGFKLLITWLEPHPRDKIETKWCDEGLPVGCGNFLHGETEETTDRLSFSHKVVHFEKGSSRSAYKIYPTKGETWALFRDWDISWCSEPEDRKFSYDFVEVVSDLIPGLGIRVVYLEKVGGFISVFQKKTTASACVLIPHTQLLRFSHRIPSFILTGNESEGVPKGSLELDPAALPSMSEESCRTDDVKKGCTEVDAEAKCPIPKSPEKRVQSMKSSEKFSTPKKKAECERKNTVENEIFKPRRSPRKLSNDDRDATQTLVQEGKAKENKSDELISPKNSAKNHGIPQSFSPGGKILEQFFNFREQKSEEKFEPGQIWALYSDGLPRKYGQVKKVETQPFRLHVAMLEVWKEQKDEELSVCGTFILQTGKPKIFSTISFSHRMEVINLSKNKFFICPRKGEVWALYVDWRADLSCSDLLNSRYEVVEVLEDQNPLFLTVVRLTRLNGFKSVFMTPRNQRAQSCIIEIRRNEYRRFSHHIPSHKLTGEKNGRLSGCWELDPASISGNLSCKD